MTKLKLFLVCIFCLGLAAACSSTKEAEKPKTAEELYNQAHNDLDRTAYKKAAETFEKVELEHPYSKWATKAKIMGAYAYYKDQKYDDAILSLDRFIKFHPGNKDIAYAYYLADSNPLIDAFIMSRQVDAPSEVAASCSFGLWSCDMSKPNDIVPTMRKQSWTVYKNIDDRKRTLETTEKYKKYIGIEKWSDVIPDFKWKSQEK